MSIALRTLVRRSDLPPDLKTVLDVLADFSNDEGDHVYPSVARIAALTSMGERTVQRRLRDLEGRGLLELVERATRYRPNEYRIRGDRLALHEFFRGDTDDTPSASGVSDQATRGVKPGTSGVTPVTPEPRTEPTTEPKAISLSTFDDFYAAYPLHKEPRKARAAYDKALQRGADPEAILAGAIAYRDDPNREAEFTKHPTTWLNGDCWNDDPTPARSSKRRPTITDRMYEALRRGGTDDGHGSNGAGDAAGRSLPEPQRQSPNP